MKKDEFSELWQFLGGYFHQDFAIEHGSAEKAIDCFLREASEGELERVRTEVEIVLSRTVDDDKLSKLLSDLGCDYYPEGDGWESARAWLSHVRDRLGG